MHRLDLIKRFEYYLEIDTIRYNLLYPHRKFLSYKISSIDSFLECLSDLKKSFVVLVVTKLFSMLNQFQLLENNGTKLVIDVVCRLKFNLLFLLYIIFFLKNERSLQENVRSYDNG